MSSKIGTTTNLGKFLEEWTLQENSGGGAAINLVATSQTQLTKAETGVTKVYTAFGITPSPTFNTNTAFVPVQAFVIGAQESEQYYFHPDHLGSSNYITNIAGDVSQHMEYFAFGETFVEEHKNSINSPYKFNGKELDEESGLYYYGARYYDPRLSIWASVDPLAEKYATRSPYEYCFSNPVNLTDPTGMGPDDPPAKNIILNFISDEKFAKFDKKDFKKNGWEVIDVKNLTDARDKLKEYLGDSKADNIYILAHGGVGEYYPSGDDGYSIKDESNATGYLQAEHSGGNFGKKGEDNWIHSNNIEDYNNPVRQKNLKPELIENIKALIDISNSVKTGKNLIFGNCNISYDKKFGPALVKNVQNVDVFMNTDICSNLHYPAEQLVPFSLFIDKNRTSKENHNGGWMQFNSSKEPKSFNNLQMTKSGVRVIK